MNNQYAAAVSALWGDAVVIVDILDARAAPGTPGKDKLETLKKVMTQISVFGATWAPLFEQAWMLMMPILTLYIAGKRAQAKAG